MCICIFASWKYCIDKCLSIKRLKVFWPFTHTNEFYRDPKLIDYTDLQSKEYVKRLVSVASPGGFHCYDYNAVIAKRKKHIEGWYTTQPPLAEPSSFVKIKPVTPTT